MMDDPVMIPAVAEGLLEPLTAAKVPNIAALKPGTIHMDGVMVHYLQPWLGIAYNPKAMKTAPTSWADTYDPKYKGRRDPAVAARTPKSLANLFMAAFLATGKPMAEAQKDIDAGFKKLVTIKPNLLTAHPQMPQAYNLLEQGEGFHDLERDLAGGTGAQGRPARRSRSPCRRKASSPCRRASRW